MKQLLFFTLCLFLSSCQFIENKYAYDKNGFKCLTKQGAVYLVEKRPEFTANNCRINEMYYVKLKNVPTYTVEAVFQPKSLTNIDNLSYEWYAEAAGYPKDLLARGTHIKVPAVRPISHPISRPTVPVKSYNSKPLSTNTLHNTPNTAHKITPHQFYHQNYPHPDVNYQSSFMGWPAHKILLTSVLLNSASHHKSDSKTCYEIFGYYCVSVYEPYQIVFDKTRKGATDKYLKILEQKPQTTKPQTAAKPDF